MALNLGSLIDTKRIEEGIWVAYKETQFQVRVSYYGKPQMAAIFERCKTKSVNLRTLKEEERINNPVFREEYADLVIREWKSLTLDVLRTLVVLKLDDLPEEVKAAAWELDCSHENRVMMIDNSVEFDQWLSMACSDVERFNQQKKEAAAKN